MAPTPASGVPECWARLAPASPPILRGMKTTDRLEEMRAKAAIGGGQQRNAQQHAEGELTAREGIDLVLDEGSFTQIDAFVLARPTELIADDDPVLGDGGVNRVG